MYLVSSLPTHMDNLKDMECFSWPRGGVCGLYPFWADSEFQKEKKREAEKSDP